MRNNTEDNNAFNMTVKSGKYSAARVVLVGDVDVTPGGSLVNFLDPNGADRIVGLPPMEMGRFYVVANVSTGAFVLNVVNSVDVPITSVEAGACVLLFASDNEWVGIQSWIDLNDFGIAGPSHRHGLVPDPGPTFNADPSHRRYLSELGWLEISEITGDDFYKYFKGGAVTLTPLGADTLEFVSANNILTILASAATTPDEIRFTINQANINHNALTNYVADQHVAHSGVTLTAGSGISGGGDITASRTFNLDLNDLVADTPVLADKFAFYDISGADTNNATLTALNAILDHNALVNYVADQHVAHSGVSIVAGTGLTGGGTIAASRTLALDINGLTADTLAVGDFMAFYDISQADHNKVTLANLNAFLDHNALANYVANQHVDHTAVSISTAAGTSGLTGGGTIAATRNLSVDINGLTTDGSPDLVADFMMTWDVSAGALKKAALSSVGAAGAVRYDTAQGLSATQQTQGRSNISAAQIAAMAAHNVVVNPAIDVSQELGTTGATLVNNTAKYIADQWEAQYNHGAATAVVTSRQLASASFPGGALAGYSFGHHIKATTAITSPANGDFAKYRQKIEGYRVAKWGWGAAGASSIVVAFQFYSTASGVALVRLSNSAADRFYYHEITVAAGWNFYAFTVAGDTTGTWVKDSGVGLTFEVIASGKETTPGTSFDTWGATAKIQTTNSTNLLGTNNNETVLTGVYIDMGTQLPVAADLPGLMRPFDVELFLSQRYYCLTYVAGDFPGVAGSLNPMVAQGVAFKNMMRVAPTVSSTVTLGSGNIASAAVGDATTYGCYFQLNATNTALRTYYYGYVLANARP